MSSELFSAAEKTFGLAGHKAKDIPALLATLKKEYNVDASISSGMLKLAQGDVVMDIGAAMQTYRARHPADFYGNTDVNFKDDLIDDQDGKIKFIREHGLAAWAALPANAKSPGAVHVKTAAIPSSHMKRAEYLRLSLEEKSKLAAEIGHQGIGVIMARK
jgi:hypothetical protein